MFFWQDPQFGYKLITLMAALVLVLQILMVAQRWLVTNIRAFGLQSFLLACIAWTIAYFNHAPHIYWVAALTVAFKAILLPMVLERLVMRIEIHQEIEPFVNVPLSVIVAGMLTLLAYVVSESFHRPDEPIGRGLGHNTLAVSDAGVANLFFL